MIPGSGSGAGPQSGGWFPSDNERASAYQKELHSSASLQWMMERSYQYERARRAAAPMMGSTVAAQNEFLYNSRMGQVAQVGLGAVATRGMAGLGNPMEMAVGLSNFIGRSGGSYQDNTRVGGGAQRNLSGSGFMTDEVVKGLWKGVQESLYGKDGSQNRVSGLDMTQVGRMMSALAPTAMYGQQHSVIRSASKDEILDRARETANPHMRDKLRGISGFNLEAKLEEARKSGDTQLSGQLNTISKATTLVDVDKKYQKELTDFTKASAALVSNLGNILGSDDMVDMLNTAKVMSGKIIRTAQDAREAKASVDRSVAFAKTQGLDPKAYIAQSVSNIHSISGMLERQGINSPALASAIGRRTMEHGAVAGKVEGALGGFSEEQATAMLGVGMSKRMEENPDMAIALHQVKYGRLDAADAREITNKANEFIKADTPEKQAAIQMDLQRLSQKHFKVSSAQYAESAGGIAQIAADAGIAEQYSNILAENIQGGSAIKGGSAKAWDMLSRKNTAALGAGGQQLGEVMNMSLNAPTRKRIFDLMKRGDSEGVKKLLEEKSQYLQNTDGSKVGVGDMMKMLSGTGGMAKSAGAIEALSHLIQKIPASAAAMSQEQKAENEAKIFASQRESGEAFSNADRKKGETTLQMFARGLFAGENGELNPVAVAAAAAESAAAFGSPDDALRAVKIGYTAGGKMDIGEAAMSQILGVNKEAADLLLSSTGAKDPKALSRMLKDSAVGSDTQKFMSQYLQTSGLSLTDIGENTGVVMSGDFKETIETQLAKTAQQAAMRKASGDESLTGTGKEMAESVLGKLERHNKKPGTFGYKYEKSELELALEGGSDGTSRLQKIKEMDKASKGEIKAGLESRLSTAQQEFAKVKDKNSDDAKYWAKEQDTIKGVLKELGGGTGEGDKVMTVGTIIVKGEIQKPGNQS